MSHGVAVTASTAAAATAAASTAAATAAAATAAGASTTGALIADIGNSRSHNSEVTFGGSFPFSQVSFSKT